MINLREVKVKVNTDNIRKEKMGRGGVYPFLENTSYLFIEFSAAAYPPNSIRD